MNRPGYISIPDAAKQLKVTTGTLHYYLRRLSIESHKFDLDRRAYLKIEDFERIRKLKVDAGTTSSEDAALPGVRCSIA